MISKSGKSLRVAYYLIDVTTKTSKEAKQNLETFKQYLRRRDEFIELVTEDSGGLGRPLWKEIVERMERGELVEIVVPAVWHITSDHDNAELESFLRKSSLSFTRFMSRLGGIDSRLQPNDKIMEKIALHNK